uniref:Large ribosomal subunit protein bL17m n=1 Tax=Timema monikensis TaxID=170555 RepID=A0A7R9HT58_9NEOP|nr:unnamed protein product [Timema monikensis]
MQEKDRKRDQERDERRRIKKKKKRGRTVQLISEAIRHGDCHRSTMEMADFWLLEKQQIHKLFKVLVPRFENYTVAFTRMFKAPRPYPGHYRSRAVLELRGNPYPPLTIDPSQNRNLIQNILLDEARKEYRAQKYVEIAEKLATTEPLSNNVVAREESSSIDPTSPLVTSSTFGSETVKDKTIQPD